MRWQHWILIGLFTMAFINHLFRYKRPIDLTTGGQIANCILDVIVVGLLVWGAA